MAADIVQRFLKNAVDVHARAGFHRVAFRGFLVVKQKAGLPFHRWNIPIESAFEAGFFEQYRVERLRKTADIVQSGLSNLPDFLQVGMERRICGHIFGGAAQQRADRGEHLAEFIVELAGDVAQGQFLSRDEFLSELTTLGREFRNALEEPVAVMNQVEAGQNNSEKDGGEKKIELALDAVVNIGDARGGEFFALVVLHQQTRYGGIERLLARLESIANLLAS